MTECQCVVGPNPLPDTWATIHEGDIPCVQLSEGCATSIGHGMGCKRIFRCAMCFEYRSTAGTHFIDRPLGMHYCRQCMGVRTAIVTGHETRRAVTARLQGLGQGPSKGPPGQGAPAPLGASGLVFESGRGGAEPVKGVETYPGRGGAEPVKGVETNPGRGGAPSGTTLQTDPVQPIFGGSSVAVGATPDRECVKCGSRTRSWTTDSVTGRVTCGSCFIHEPVMGGFGGTASPYDVERVARMQQRKLQVDQEAARALRERACSMCGDLSTSVELDRATGQSWCEKCARKVPAALAEEPRDPATQCRKPVLRFHEQASSLRVCGLGVVVDRTSEFGSTIRPCVLAADHAGSCSPWPTKPPETGPTKKPEAVPVSCSADADRIMEALRQNLEEATRVHDTADAALQEARKVQQRAEDALEMAEDQVEAAVQVWTCRLMTMDAAEWAYDRARQAAENPVDRAS